jgi:hypothetical protein
MLDDPDPVLALLPKLAGVRVGRTPTQIIFMRKKTAG